jgi:hypothetical protein
MNGQSKKPVGFFLLSVSIFLAYHSFKIYSGEVSLPYGCTGRGQLFCEFVNIVFKQSGYFAVVMLTLGASIFVFVIAYALITSDTTISKSSERLPTKATKVLSKNDDNNRQTLNDVLVDGQEPTTEFLEELNAVHNAPPLSDDELEKQALR